MKLMALFVLLFLVAASLPSPAVSELFKPKKGSRPKIIRSLRAPAQAISLKEACGPTLLTQWTLDLKTNRLFFVRAKKHQAEFCEPGEPVPGTTNATALFIDIDGRALWTRKIMVPLFQNYDQLDSKGQLSGGVLPLTKAEIQIKIPQNEITARLGWLQIILDNGAVVGPTGIPEEL
jgi:hypothetical protein